MTLENFNPNINPDVELVTIENFNPTISEEEFDPDSLKDFEPDIVSE